RPPPILRRRAAACRTAILGGNDAHGGELRDDERDDGKAGSDEAEMMSPDDRDRHSADQARSRHAEEGAGGVEAEQYRSDRGSERDEAILLRHKQAPAGGAPDEDDRYGSPKARASPWHRRADNCKHSQGRQDHHARANAVDETS